MNRPRWRWSNVPVPEVNIVLLLASIGFHLFLPLKMLPAAWISHAAGWPTVLAGLLLIAWAVSAVGATDLARPSGIVTSGPYRFSRHPMYLGWILISLGIGMIVNSTWVVMFVLGTLFFAHVVIIPGEERALEKRFGQKYVAYQQRVRRWL
ncbi:MAG: isoprenylcysteine carboxylmethyltransferase family protein [Dehalococcoidia bacterium]